MAEKVGDPSDEVLIYLLSDPRSGIVRYVGRTENLEQRLEDHMKLKGNARKRSWIQELLILGIRPVVWIWEKVSREDWQRAEREAIAWWDQHGADLTNITEGGDGAKYGYEVSKLTRARMRKRMLGNQINAGRKVSEAERLAFIQHMEGNQYAKGYHHTEETKKKISESCIKKWDEPGFRERESEKRKGHVPWNKGLRYKHHKNRVKD